MKPYPKIVLTGGPRSGKSSVIKFLQHQFGYQDTYTPIFVPELATKVFSAGISIQTISKKDTSYLMFQMNMIKSQIQQEDSFRQFVNCMSMADNTQKFIMVLDRALLDNLAYMTQQQCEAVLRGLGTTEKSMASRYDYVLHLETSAVSEDYDPSDNPSRHELDRQVAIDSCDRVKAVWQRNVFLGSVGYMDDFTKKCDHVLEKVLEVADNFYERSVNV